MKISRFIIRRTPFLESHSVAAKLSITQHRPGMQHSRPCSALLFPGALVAIQHRGLGIISGTPSANLIELKDRKSAKAAEGLICGWFEPKRPKHWGI